MLILEIIMGICFLVLSVLAVKSDISEGLIYNKVLLGFAAIAAVLDFLYYGLFTDGSAAAFILNLVIVAAICLFLFYTHSFAGGDCKLGTVMALLYPGRFYLNYGSTSCTLFFAIGIAIFYGYVYLMVAAIGKLASGKNHMTFRYVRNYLKEFLNRYLKSIVILCGISLIIVFIQMHGIQISVWIVRLVCIGIVWLIGKNNFFSKWKFLLPITALDIIGAIFLKVIPLSMSIEHYILVGVLLICQMTIRTNLYQEIEIAKLKKGMILSSISSAMMQGSRIRGLPGVSSEDLSSRLSESEVESIQRWSQNKGVTSVSIVRKIPFAIFLSLGFISYFIIWGIIE